MILYHFTTPDNVPFILRKGLLAKNANAINDLTGFPVVWLTDVPTLDVSLEMRRVMLRRGLVCGPHYRYLPLATVCLKVIIPTTDKRLKHFPTWLRKHPVIDPDDPLINPRHWFYRGNIAPGAVSVFKTVSQGVMHWDLTLVREAWQNGAEVIFPADLEADLLAGRFGPDDYVKAHSGPPV